MRTRIWLVVTLTMGGLLAALAAGAAVRPARAAGSITVYRDHFGVAHVEAQDLQGLAYATGYLTAHDRLFEMDVIRKLGQGRLSELTGPSMLPMDRYTRREFLLQTDIDGQYAALSPQMKSLYEAYTAGVNRGAIETLATRTPALMVALGDPWEPWTTRDSIIVDMVFTEVTFGGEGAGGELANATLLSHLQQLYGPDEGMRAFNDLVPPSYPDAPTVIPPGDGPPVPSGAGYDTTAPAASQQPLLHLGGLALAAAAQANELSTIHKVISEFHVPLPRIGSYAAAISGSRTASHGGLLLGSPQSGLLAPPIFYEIGWHIPGVTDCEGFTVPGLGPAIGIGWCNQHAWTLVAGNMGDQADLFVERLDPQNPHRYWLNGAWRDTVQRTTTYLVKGTATCPPAKGFPAGPCPPEVLTETYDYTAHGAINAVDKADSAGFAYQRAQNGVFLRSLYGSAGWDLSHDMNGFMSATDAFTATYNMLYTDADGHIAYRFTGLQPVRPGTDRRFPMPGTGEAEWQGYLNQCQMPHDADPSTGYFAVNQGTESKSISWWPNSSAVGVGVASRVGHDQQLLAALQPATMESLRALNKHLLEEDDPYAATFYPLFAHALEGSGDPRLRQALAQLEAWRADGFSRTDRNGDNLEDHPGLAIFELDNIDYSPPDDGYQVPLGDTLIAAIVGPPTGGNPPGTYNAQLSTVYEVLARHTAHRFVDDPDAVIRAAVSQVVDKLTRQYGTGDMSRWHQKYPKEPFTALEAVGPNPVKGMDHGSYSQIIDLGAHAGENVEPPGNVAADSPGDTVAAGAGHPPAHFDDQRSLYEAYQFKPMLMTPARYRADPEAVFSLDDGGTFGSDTAIDYSFHRDACRNAVAASATGASSAAAPAAKALPSTAASPLAPAGGAATGLLLATLAGRRHRKRREQR